MGKYVVEMKYELSKNGNTRIVFHQYDLYSRMRYANNAASKYHKAHCDEPDYICTCVYKYAKPIKFVSEIDSRYLINNRRYYHSMFNPEA